MKGDAVYRYRNPQDGHPRRGEGRVASNKVGVASPGTGRLNGRRCLLGERMFDEFVGFVGGC